ncbi:UPF0182 family membrane protein [Nakamurella panacisegetis]|nr:UPF0182 family protein [Nakamurella panacisegetis]
MRPPIGMPSMSKRSKRVLITLVALVVLAILWFQFVGVFVDWLWFGEVGYRQVWTTEIVSKIVLFLIGGIGAGGVVFLALNTAYRSRPVFVPSGEVDPLSPYRTVVSSRPKTFVFAISILVGLICAFSTQGDWQTVQLWLHAVSFGKSDPQFGHDVGFYVFTLPFLQMIISWLFALAALSFFAVLVTQYLYGGLRFSGPGRRITSQASLQLSLLVGVFVLVKAIQYWFDRYALLFSNRGGKFTGASYTDVNAVLPAKIILMVIAAICAVGFIVGAFLRSVKLPAIALALLVLSSVLIGGVWPLILQQVVVNPNGITKEPPYIAKNIAATRAAYDIGSDKVKYVNYSDETSSTPLTATGNPTISNARLLDPNILSSTFTQNEQQKNFYGFADPLSVDRYTDPKTGKTQDYIVAVRELNTAGLTGDQTNWIQEHMVYTHGNGFIATPANQVGSDGYPVFSGNVSDVSNSGTIKVTQPRIYYGSQATTYAIVGSDSPNSNREYDTDSTSYTYAGSGGVKLDNLFDRLVFATHYGEANFLFSSEINGNSKIMYNRDPLDRVRKAAPFLTTDSNPYPAVVDGKIVWIVDAYTTAQNYPYSQSVSLASSTTNSQTTGTGAQANTDVSYIRNSVKATVDAYTGAVTLYSVDDADPVLKAWEGVFPNLIKPSSDISTDLRAHFRYPQDLFEIQRKLLTQYHVDSPVDFFQNSNYWDVPADPTEAGNTAAQPPYYQQIALPGQTSTSFQLTSALTIYQRQFMAAFVSASSDPKTYGDLTVLQLPQNTQTPGPVLIQQAFNSNQAISNFVTTRQTSGRSQVIYGNLLTLPTDNGLLYVEPLYIKGVSTSASPQLGQVLVWYANRVGYGTTLADALQVAAASAPTPITGTGTGTSSGSSTSSGSATLSSSSSPSTPVVLPSDQAQALSAMDAANKALATAKASGDLGKIGAASQALEDAVNNYLKLAGTSLTTPSTTSAAPTATATSPTG